MANLKALGTAIDALRKEEEKLDELQAKVSAQKKVIEKAATALLRRFKKSELDGAKGKRGVAVIVERDLPTVEDFSALCRYVKKKDAFDLFQKRLSSEAYLARLEAGEKVPGVGVFHSIKLSVRARR